MAKGRGRYESEERKTSKRKYMSYEDVPLEENDVEVCLMVICDYKI